MVSVNTSGNISPVQQANLNFGQPGTVQAVTVTVGSSVKAGQLLAQLDTTQFNLSLQNVQASLKSAQDKLAQDQHPSTPQDIAGAQAAAGAAEADYQNMIAPPTQADLTSAEQSVASAQAVYNAAISTASTGNDSLNAAAGAVQTAQAAMQQAQAAYNKVASQPNIAMLPQSLTLQQTYHRLPTGRRRLPVAADHDAVRQYLHGPAGPGPNRDRHGQPGEDREAQHAPTDPGGQ